MISEIITATAGEKEYIILVLVVLALMAIAVIIGSLLLCYVLRNQSVSKAKHFMSFLALILALDFVIALDVLGVGNLPTMMIVKAIILTVILTEFAFGIYDHQKAKHAEIEA